MIISTYNELYKTGFHFFLTKEDAETYKAKYSNEKVIHVKIKDIVVTGKQGRYDVGVAREIFIEED